MSRMILTISALSFFSGCTSFEAPHRISLVAARVESMGPNRVPFEGRYRRCDGCIPPRPLTVGYLPGWDYFLTQHTAQRCAFNGLREYRRQCGRPVSHHFKAGFIAAYEDLALNRRPSPPIVPPEKYWNAFYRSCAGRPVIDEWYAGYDAGLAIGTENGASRFGELYIRRDQCGFDQSSQYDDGPAPQLAQTPQPPLTPIPQTQMPVANPYGFQGP